MQSSVPLVTHKQSVGSGHSLPDESTMHEPTQR